LAEDVEVGAAVHLAFQELQARDSALALGVAPLQFEGGPDAGVVGADAAGGARFQSGVETGAGLGPDEPDEGRDCVVGGCEFGILPYPRRGGSLRCV